MIISQCTAQLLLLLLLLLLISGALITFYTTNIEHDKIPCFNGDSNATLTAIKFLPSFRNIMECSNTEKKKILCCLVTWAAGIAQSV
jgi:hypothetical protein